MTAIESTLDPSVLSTLHVRRAAGETLSALAREVGITWQRLWVLMVSTQTKEMLPAVARFHQSHGPHWKAFLCACWMGSQYPLYAIRNGDKELLSEVHETFGLGWLAAYQPLKGGE